MKKLFIIGQIPKEYGGSYTTGVANVIIELADVLKDDFDIYLYATNYKDTKVKENYGFKILGYSYTKFIKLIILQLVKNPLLLVKLYKEFNNEFGIPPVKFILNHLLLRYYIDKLKPEIINAHGIVFSPLLKNLKNSAKVFFTFHGLMYDDDNSIKANKKRGIDVYKLYNNGAKYIDNPIYLTEEMKIKGEYDLKIESKQSYIIPNGVNVAKFRFCETSRDELRVKFGVNDNDLIFISVGALTNRKNHIGFIKYLIKNDFKGQYWIIGKFEAEQTKQQILEYQKSIKDFKIRIFDYVAHETLYKYYSAADIYAHPSTSEGQALVVFESLCCGLPVLVNEEIKGTVSVGENYTKSVIFINLKEQRILPEFNIDREKLSLKCKTDFNWNEIGNLYKNVFTNE